MEDDRPQEIIILMVLAQADRDDVARGSACADVSIVHGHQSLLLQFVIEPDEGRVLHD